MARRYGVVNHQKRSKQSDNDSLSFHPYTLLAVGVSVGSPVKRKQKSLSTKGGVRAANTLQAGVFVFCWRLNNI